MLTRPHCPGTTLIQLGYQNSPIPSFVRPDVYDAPCAILNQEGQYFAIYRSLSCMYPTQYSKEESVHLSLSLSKRIPLFLS